MQKCSPLVQLCHVTNKPTVIGWQNRPKALVRVAMSKAREIQIQKQVTLTFKRKI